MFKWLNKKIKECENEGSKVDELPKEDSETIKINYKGNHYFYVSDMDSSYDETEKGWVWSRRCTVYVTTDNATANLTINEHNYTFRIRTFTPIDKFESHEEAYSKILSMDRSVIVEHIKKDVIRKTADELRNHSMEINKNKLKNMKFDVNISIDVKREDLVKS